MRLEFSHTPDDWIEAARAREPWDGQRRGLRDRRRTARREATAWTLLIVGCVLLAASGGFLGVRQRQPLWFLPTIFAVAFLWFVVRQVWSKRSPAAIRRKFATDEQVAGPITFEIDDAGLHQVKPDSEYHIEWSAIRSFFETPALLVFVDDTPLKFFVPKRAFADHGGRDAFRARVRSHLATARNEPLD